MIFTATGIMLAAPRSLEQARKAAAVQMKKHSAKKASAHGGTVAAVSPQLVLAKEKQNKDEAYYYVFSAGRDLGYTIVSGDDRFPAIIGYTESGNYKADNIPENFKNFMLAYQQLLDNATEEQIAEISAWKASNSSKIREAVPPLMTTTWGQDEPYNNMCPEFKTEYSENVNSATGCTATAVAQILRYWKCPKQLEADIPAYKSQMRWGGVDYITDMESIPKGEVYDWDNMLDSYNTGNETQEQKDAVAKLMLHVGCACRMGYSPDGSGAAVGTEEFIKYFGMDKELTRFLFRSWYNMTEWDDILYNEMINSRPVYYTGDSKYIGHAFVIHGYNDGLYYVNWGWDGWCDGYFDINVLNPNNDKTDDEYNLGATMIIGIQPDNGKSDEIKQSVIKSERGIIFTPTVDTETKTISGNVEGAPGNWYLKGITYVGIGYKDENGNVINVCNNPIEINSETLSLGGYMDCNFDVSFQYEENKLYKLCLIESRDKVNWMNCIAADTTAVNVKIVDGKAILTTPQIKLTATIALDENSSGYAGENNTMNITLTNSGDKEYYGQIFIMVSETDAVPEKFTFAYGRAVPAGGSVSFDINYLPSASGTYKFFVMDADYWFVPGKVIGQNSIIFKDAGDTESSLNFVYNDNDMTATVTGKNKIFSEIVIPATITRFDKTYTVVAIGDNAFENSNGLTSVTIPNSVTSIGSSTFSGCSSLTSLTLSNSVTSIGSSAFSGCSSLTSLTLSNSVTSIGYCVFYGCSGLTSLTIPNSVTSIGDYAFYGCSSLTSLTLPNSVTSIGLSAFAYCNGLTSLTLPNSVTSIGSSAFAYCNGLTSLTLSNSVTSIGYWTFAYCSSLTSLTIPNSVTSIGDGAFGGCCGLTSLTIPNSVTSIGNGVFGGCSGLTSLTLPNSGTSIGDGAFDGCSSLASLIIPNSVTSIGDMAFHGCSGLTSLDIPNSVTSIGFMAFADCSSLTSLTLPNSITSIAIAVCQGCSSLTSLTLPNSVTSIGENAFSGCSSLTSLTLPNSVTSIGDGAFLYCSGLTSLTLPNSVTSIGIAAFEGCWNLTDEVYSLNPTPPSVPTPPNTDIFWLPFDECTYLYATLYVPEESLEAYKNAEYWKDFLNIKGVASTGMLGFEVDGNGKQKKYYNINGRRLSTPKKGLNIIDGKKVIVK